MPMDRLRVDSAKPCGFLYFSLLVRYSRKTMLQTIGSTWFARNVVVDKLQ
jgi:hypothetical protein